MQKPMTVARREFSEAVVEVVNGSGLPFFVIRQVLEGLLSAVRQGEEEQERKDRAEYEAYLRESAAQETDDRTDAAEGGKEGVTYGDRDDSDTEGQARDV